MMAIDLSSLMQKLNPTCRVALENAAGLCVSNYHYEVEIEHWLLKLIDDKDNEILAIFQKYKIDIELLKADLHKALQRLKSGNSRPPTLSPSIIELSKESWLLASIEYGYSQSTSTHILCALLGNDSLRRQMLESSGEFTKISTESLSDYAKSIVGKTAESNLSQVDNPTETTNKAATDPSTTPALDKFTINLTERARQNEIDPVYGRDQEVRQMIDILTRRRQNNPILTGEAGVGKTAVVEGLALRIAANDVPAPLQGVSLRTLDLGLLQAGASIKGEFEKRLKSVISEVKSSAQAIILFIDEAHSLIGAGGKEGQGDAANLLKPALARGELRTIAATTWSEYKRYFERDPALSRRFQVINVAEPDVETAIDMMRGISKSLQAHHKVRILDDAIVAAVKLSSRYISGRQLPDKCLSLLDTACARVALNQSTTPAPIEDLQRQIQQINSNIELLRRETATGGDCAEQIELRQGQQIRLQARLDSLQVQWQTEQAITGKILQIQGQLEQDYIGKIGKTDATIDVDTTFFSSQEIASLKHQLKQLTLELTETQSDSPLLQTQVDRQAVAEVLSNWTGIPVGRMHTEEINSILDLQHRLEQRVIGQSHALAAIAQNIHTASANLTDPRKPTGVFLMVGPSGVGKTETALALADLLYGGEQNLTVINMSEFKEEHKISTLLGSPPGYVGYGEGGILTEAVRRKPYSVILLDEMEKAHRGIQEIFYNLFDKGSIKDGEGRDIDFKNTVIIMTSNAGEQLIHELCDSHKVSMNPEQLLAQIRPELLKHFRPAFLGRCEVIPYYPLSDTHLVHISEFNMKKIELRIASHYQADFSYSHRVPLNIVARCQEVDTGARNIENILNRSILPELATQCLSRLASEQSIAAIHIDVDQDQQFVYDIR